MLRRRLGAGAGAVLMVLVGGCTETVVRCRAGFVAADGMEGQTRCVSADAGALGDASADAMDACDRSAADRPGDGQDSNCDGVDGVVGDTVFVAMGGEDTNSGLAPEQPVRTVTRALAIARGGTRRSILIGVGDYSAQPVALDDGGTEHEVATHLLVDGITLSGRYAGGAGGWVTRSSDASQRSLLRGTITAAIIRDLRTGVTFHDVDLMSERNAVLGSLSCYGLIAVGSGVVTLDRGRVQACSGSSAPATPPSAGSTGASGVEGQDGTMGGGGGAGCSAGNGGRGGTEAMRAGAMGAAGTATGLGAAAAGGRGGTMDSLVGANGETGVAGQVGRPVAMGGFTVAGYEVPLGDDGESGGTGGGGGGGFATGPSVLGGGGGGGGCGGGGGSQGVSGGASIGVFAWGETIRVSLTDTTLQTLGGGDGGPGGVGGEGGPGGGGGASTGGGTGGRGGRGGRGGDGAAGAGGPSFGVVVLASAVVDAPSVMWNLGTGGMSGNPLVGRARQEQVYRVTGP